MDFSLNCFTRGRVSSCLELKNLVVMNLELTVFYHLLSDHNHSILPFAA